MNVKIKPSPIHGRGVFACERIHKGQWRYVYGDIRIVEPGDPIEDYGVEWDDERTYIPYAPWCRCNHSDTPNCVIEILEEEDMLIITTLTTIKSGEEMTIDYGFDPSKE